MRILVAKNEGTKEQPTWKRVGTYYVRKDGGMSLPLKYNGTLASHLIRNGAKYLVGEPAAQSVDCEYANEEYRVFKI